MNNGNKLSCLINLWMQETIKELTALVEVNELTLSHTSDLEIESYLFDFPFMA